MTSLLKPILLPALILVSGCVTMPEGPSVLVLPGTGKSFDQFRLDDMDCRQFASSQVGGTTAAQAGVDSGVKSAAIGTIVGAAAGAAIGGSRGAGTGAGAGLAVGTLGGTAAAQESGHNLQKRYDFGYQQCMYAKGHRVPISGRFDYQSRQQTAYPPPPPPPPSP
jgi:hypothetical protein